MTHRTGIQLKTFLTCALAVLFMASVGFAQEHPTEHPTKTKKEHPTKTTSEHPKEHPTDATATKAVTKEALAVAITSFVNADSKLKGGFFMVYDPVSEAPLLLTLTKVHEDKLALLSETLFFVCADFKEASGKIYDLDFFMTSDDGGLVVSEVIVHKQDNKPRYTWSEKDGVWSRKKS